MPRPRTHHSPCPWCAQPHKQGLTFQQRAAATTRRRRIRTRAIQTRSGSRDARIRVLDNCVVDVVAQLHRRPRRLHRRLQHHRWTQPWPHPWLRRLRQPGRGCDVATCRVVLCYGTSLWRKIQFMGRLDHKMVKMGIFSTSFEQRLLFFTIGNSIFLIRFYFTD